MARMTAKIIHDGVVLESRHDDDFHNLSVFVLYQLEENYTEAYGEIIENYNAEVIQRFRRRPIC